MSTVTKKELGEVTRLLKQMLPMVQNVSDWVDELRSDFKRGDESGGHGHNKPGGG